MAFALAQFTACVLYGNFEDPSRKLTGGGGVPAAPDYLALKKYGFGALTI
jgi:hypothetical protein